MKSKRRFVGLSLGCVAVVLLTAWLAWDCWPGAASTAFHSRDRSEAECSTEKSAATDHELDSEPSAASDPSAGVDFSGQWQLDVDASESADTILTAIGLSYLERALVNNTVVTHILTQTADELTLEIQTSFFSRTDHLPLDGQPMETLDPSGRAVQSISAWSDDRMRIITKVWVKPADQHFTLTRSLDPQQGTMEVFVEYFPTDGQTMTSRRVYRRIDSHEATKSP